MIKRWWRRVRRFVRRQVLRRETRAAAVVLGEDRIPRKIREQLALSIPTAGVAELRDMVTSYARDLTLVEQDNLRLESLVHQGLDFNLPGFQNQAYFRTVQGGPETRDLGVGERWRMHRLIHRIFALRGEGNNLIELMVDFVIGDGFEPQPENPENKKLQEALKEIWEDDRNDLAGRHENIVRTWYLEGECFQSADLSFTDGHLELGWLPPERVHSVVKDRRGRDAFLLVQSPKPGGELLKYFILDSLSDRIEITAGPDTGEDSGPAGGDNANYTVIETILDVDGKEREIRENCHGLTFAWFVNRPEGATRGRSDLLTVVDHIDLHDELLWSAAEKEKLARMYVMIVKLKNANTKEEIEAALRDMGLTNPPQDPRVLGVNEGTEIDMATASQPTGDAMNVEHMLRMNIYGAKGFPEHFSGSAKDANRATAAVQMTVPGRRLGRRQNLTVRAFTRLIEVSLVLRERFGKAVVTNDGIGMNATDVLVADKKIIAAYVREIATALQTALGNGILRKDAANAIIVQVIRESGLTVLEKFGGLPDEADDALKKMIDMLSKQDAVDDKDDEGDDEVEVVGTSASA